MNTSSRINRFKFSPAFSYTRSSYGESAGSKSISALSTCKKEYGFPFTTSLASSLFNTSYGKAATCAAFLLLDEWPETVGFLPHSSLLYTIIRTATTPVILLYFPQCSLLLYHQFRYQYQSSVRPRMFTTINHIRNIYMMFC